MPGLKVRGRSYATAAELEAEIRELEAMRDDELDELRNAGNEATADRRADAYAGELNALQGALRTLKEREARAASTEGSSSSRAPTRRRSSSSSAPRRRASARPRSVTRETGDLLRDSRRDVGRAAGGVGIGGASLGDVGDLVFTIGGATIAAVLVYALINERGRGPAAVAGLAGAGQGLISRILDPRDPLVLGPKPTPAGNYVGGSPSASIIGSPFGPGGAFDPNPGAAPKLPSPWSSAAPKLSPVPAKVATRAGIVVNTAILPSVERVAQMFGLRVNSGYRTPAQNLAAGGAPDSGHLAGDAVDFTGPADALRRAYDWALGQGFPYVEPLDQAAKTGPHLHITFTKPN